MAGGPSACGRDPRVSLVGLQPTDLIRGHPRHPAPAKKSVDHRDEPGDDDYEWSRRRHLHPNSRNRTAMP